MPREKDSRPQPDEKRAARSRREAARCVPTRQETCVVGFCTLLLSGCTSTPQVVRPPPRPADCPPGAVETMREWGLRTGDQISVSFQRGSPERVTVHESSPVRLEDDLGKRAYGVELTGRLYFSPERVYGRFTQARWRDGKTYPVCFELGVSVSFKWMPGVEREDVGGPADSAEVISLKDVQAVERFE